MMSKITNIANINNLTYQMVWITVAIATITVAIVLAVSEVYFGVTTSGLEIAIIFILAVNLLILVFILRSQKHIGQRLNYIATSITEINSAQQQARSTSNSGDSVQGQRKNTGGKEGSTDEKGGWTTVFRPSDKKNE